MNLASSLGRRRHLSRKRSHLRVFLSKGGGWKKNEIGKMSTLMTIKLSFILALIDFAPSRISETFRIGRIVVGSFAS